MARADRPSAPAAATRDDRQPDPRGTPGASSPLDNGSESRYIDGMSSDLDATRELLSRQLTEAIATDAIGALPIITALQKETDEHLRDAVRQAAGSSSWREIATALGVSKQAAHQRFRVYAKGVAEEMKVHQRPIKQARRNGDNDRAVKARARVEELAGELRTAARSLKNQV
jgi:hypothetical protein